VVVQELEAARIEPADVLVEGVDEDAKGEILLELGGRPGQNQVAARIGASDQLGQEPSLADSRLSCDLDGRRPPSPQLAQSLVERVELGVAANEMCCELNRRGVLPGFGTVLVKHACPCRSTSWRA
jgi:hypothetical protein